MSAESILIVDDNAANSKLMKVLFVSEGYQVRCAGDAEEALALLRGHTPDLILMDLQMPGMDGFELTRRLKASPDTGHVIILAVTAYAMKGDEARAFAAGCDGYISKPIDTRALPRVVAEFLKKRPRLRSV